MKELKSLLESVGKSLGTMSPYVLQRSRELSELPLDESLDPSDGLFYCVRFPEGWELYSIRVDDFGEMVHPDVWEELVSPLVATKWSRVLKVSAPELLREVREYCYGFPRGRVVKNIPEGQRIYSSEIPKQIPRDSIERAFGLTNPKWMRDLHEVPLKYERDALRKLLKIKETWDARDTGMYGW